MMIEDSREIFERDSFKDLCMKVLPMIGGIMQAVKESGVEAMSNLTTGEDGYFRFNVHGSQWELLKLKDDEAISIRHNYSEAIKMPEEKVAFGHLTENIMEITLVYANMLATNPELSVIDNIDWKHKFVEWANEFESQWEEDDIREYLEEIDKFARNKILEYLKEEV